MFIQNGKELCSLRFEEVDFCINLDEIRLQWDNSFISTVSKYYYFKMPKFSVVALI